MATDRLKRKLDQVNAGNLNESFCEYGTPLPSLADTKKDKNEFVPLHKQEVRDEKGRRRFHGAFTGGFSAGHYNSVGSVEGWAPSKFVSSRSKAGQKDDRSTADLAQAFMDEEDLADLASARKLETSSQFASSYDPLTGTGPAPSLPGTSTSNISTILADLIQPSNEKVGEKLMRKMGWRDGQGLGPRMTAEKRKAQSRDLGLDEDSGNLYLPTGEAAKRGLAPLDRPITRIWRDISELELASGPVYHGLGWVRHRNLQPSGNRHHAPEPSNKERKMPVGGAWGLGALEDAEMDDANVYDVDNIRTNRPFASRTSITDLDDDPDDSVDVIMRDAPRGARETRSRIEDHEDDSTFNDGTRLISGFARALRIAPKDKWPDKIDVPRGWEPDPNRVWRVQLDRQIASAPRANLSADERGHILGEEKLPAAQKSVFDYMSTKDKERLATLGKDPPPEASTEVQAPQTSVIVPFIEQSVASAALKGFMPFGDNPSRQARYRTFLEVSAGLRSRDEVKFTPGRTKEGKLQSIPELNKELEDFAKSARVFKPMSGAMANRFTSASSESTAKDMKAPEPGLYQPTFEKKSESEEITQDKEPSFENESPMAKAARMGMFGPLTHAVQPFYPNRLLCKRFRVQDPHPDGAPVEPKAEDRMETVMLENGFKPSEPTQDQHPSSESVQPAHEKKASERVPLPGLGSVGLGNDDSQGQDTLTYKKPSMDIFKAIFAESDDEEESDDEPASDPLPLEKPKTAGPTQGPLHPSENRDLVVGEDVSPELGGEEIKVVDATFKPSFISKTERSTASGAKTIETSRPTKKPKKSKKAERAKLSFDIDDNDEEVVVPRKIKKTSKSEKKRKKPVESDEELEWVEKPPAPSQPSDQNPAPPAPPNRQGRLKASDLID